MKKSRWLVVLVACAMMLTTFSVGALAATNGSAVDFNFSISSKSKGYTSNPIAKTTQYVDGYVVVARNQSSLGGNAETAFITVKSTGIQLSDEVVIKGTGDFVVDYNTVGETYIGDACVRANAAAAIHLLVTECQGQYYPDGL